MTATIPDIQHAHALPRHEHGEAGRTARRRLLERGPESVRGVRAWSLRRLRDGPDRLRGHAATPRRFIDALIEATDGYEGDQKLLTAFPTECHGGTSCELAQIVEGPIPSTRCASTTGCRSSASAWVGYVAHERIIGISKLTRLVRVVTRRFGVQERMTHRSRPGSKGCWTPTVSPSTSRPTLCTSMRGVRDGSADPNHGLARHLRAGAALLAEFFTLRARGRDGAR